MVFVVILSVFSGPVVTAGNFSTGALLNSEWTCINPNSKASGPLSDSKVAELKMAPTSMRTKNSFTLLQFNKFKLTAQQGKYSVVALSVFKGTKTYKQSFIKIKTNSEEQKIDFLVQVPTSEMSKIVFGITIQNPADKKMVGTCIPNSVYQKLLPVVSPPPPMPDSPPADSRIPTSAAFAQAAELCRNLGEISLNKDAPLICDSGVWTEVSSNADTVATRAYRSLLARYNQMPDSQPNLLLRIDPKAGEWKNGIVGAINAAARLWGTSTPSDRAVPAYISENGEYISENLAKDGLRENPEDAQRNKEAAARGGGQAGFHGPYFDFIFSQQGEKSTGYYQSGAHEYTHYSQMIFSKTQASQGLKEFWINEGCASYIGLAMGGIIGFPQDLRAQTMIYVTQVKNPQPLTFYSMATEALYANPDFNQIYDMGSFACEAMVALNGIESLESYFKALSVQGSSPQSVFPAVFGTQLKSYLSLMQKYVDSVRGDKTMSLSQLQAEYEKIKT